MPLSALKLPRALNREREKNLGLELSVASHDGSKIRFSKNARNSFGARARVDRGNGGTHLRAFKLQLGLSVPVSGTLYWR